MILALSNGQGGKVTMPLANLSGTQRYLTMTQELLAEASRRFEAFAQGARHD